MHFAISGGVATHDARCMTVRSLFGNRKPVEGIRAPSLHLLAQVGPEQLHLARWLEEGTAPSVLCCSVSQLGRGCFTIQISLDLS